LKSIPLETGSQWILDKREKTKFVYT